VTDAPPSTDVSAAAVVVRKYPRNRFWGLFLGFFGAIIVALVAADQSPALPIIAFGVVLGGIAAVIIGPDRCSGCRARLPLQVLDTACPSCGRVIVGVESGGGVVRLPEPALRTVAETNVPYRASAAAARDAAEAVEALAARRDIEGLKKKLEAEPAIAAAIKARDDLALHRLLRERRRKAKTVAEEEATRAVFTDPRRRLEPNKRPWLGVRKSTGLLLASPRDRDDSDASFIADQLLVVGTFPVVPLGAYLVRRPDASKIEVLGRVTLSWWKRLWRGVVFAIAAVPVAFGVNAVIARLSGPLNLVNPLDVAVIIDVDGEPVRLEPGARTARDLRRGRHHVVTKTERGDQIDAVDVDVPGGDAFVVYDVLGAEAFVVHEVAYSQYGAAPRELHHELVVLRTFAREDVKYVLVQPPEKVRSYVEFVAWAVAQVPNHWRGAAGALAETGHAEDAAKLVAAVSLAEPEDAAAAATAVHTIARAAGVERARAFVEVLAAQAPGSPATAAAKAALKDWTSAAE
jgi:hypothetical protein